MQNALASLDVPRLSPLLQSQGQGYPSSGQVFTLAQIRPVKESSGGRCRGQRAEVRRGL